MVILEFGLVKLYQSRGRLSKDNFQVALVRRPNANKYLLRQVTMMRGLCRVQIVYFAFTDHFTLPYFDGSSLVSKSILYSIWLFVTL